MSATNPKSPEGAAGHDVATESSSLKSSSSSSSSKSSSSVMSDSSSASSQQATIMTDTGPTVPTGGQSPAELKQPVIAVAPSADGSRPMLQISPSNTQIAGATPMFQTTTTTTTAHEHSPMGSAVTSQKIIGSPSMDQMRTNMSMQFTDSNQHLLSTQSILGMSELPHESFQRPISSCILEEEVLEAPNNEVIHYVEVESIVEVPRYVPLIQTVEVEKRVPVYEYETVEKLVEVPKVQYVDKYVEIDKHQEVVRHVPKREVIEVKKEYVKHVPIIEHKKIEKTVEVAGEIIEVPKPYIMEKVVQVPKWRDVERPVVIAQTINPVVKDAPNEIMDIDVVEHVPEIIEVEVQVPKPISGHVLSMGITEQRHRLVHDVPAAQFNTLLKLMNPHVKIGEHSCPLPYIPSRDGSIELMENVPYMALPPGSKIVHANGKTYKPGTSGYTVAQLTNLATKKVTEPKQKQKFPTTARQRSVSVSSSESERAYQIKGSTKLWPGQKKGTKRRGNSREPRKGPKEVRKAKAATMAGAPVTVTPKLQRVSRSRSPNKRRASSVESSSISHPPSSVTSTGSGERRPRQRKKSPAKDHRISSPHAVKVVHPPQSHRNVDSHRNHHSPHASSMQSYSGRPAQRKSPAVSQAPKVNQSMRQWHNAHLQALQQKSGGSISGSAHGCRDTPNDNYHRFAPPGVVSRYASKEVLGSGGSDADTLSASSYSITSAAGLSNRFRHGEMKSRGTKLDHKLSSMKANRCAC